jgi:hypothetical protein
MRPAGARGCSIDGRRRPPDTLARLQRCFSIDHGGEEFGLHELVDSLESLAFWAIAVCQAALVIQQHFQIASKFLHNC